MNKELSSQYDDPGEELVPLIENRFVWASASYVPRTFDRAYFFSVQNQFSYLPFNQDWGPYSLAQTIKYLNKVDQILTHPDYKTSLVFHYVSRKKTAKANAALLVGVFLLAKLGGSAQEFSSKFKLVGLDKFRDSSIAKQSAELSVLDCLRGIEKAMQLGWLDFERYDVKLYSQLASKQWFNTTFIVPNKVVIFADLLIFEQGEEFINNQQAFVQLLKKMGLELVFRLSQQNYKQSLFRREGVLFHQLYRPADQLPSEDTIQEMFRRASEVKGVIGFQCKDGQTHSSVMAAIYLIETYSFEVQSLVGLFRVIRPGSLPTAQHEFLRKRYRDRFYFPFGDPKDFYYGDKEAASPRRKR